MLSICFTDFRKELAEVKTELQEVEADIEALLQRQGKLLDRKDELEAILSQSSSKSTVKDEQWEKSGIKKDYYAYWKLKIVGIHKHIFIWNEKNELQLYKIN